MKESGQFFFQAQKDLYHLFLLKSDILQAVKLGLYSEEGQVLSDTELDRLRNYLLYLLPITSACLS